MAERPSELNKEIPIIVEETTSVVVISEPSDNINLKDSLDENYSSGAEYSNDGETDKNETSDDTEQIKANIEETRAEMSETIDAIQEKLSFSNISEQVKAEVSEYVGETIQTAKNTVYDATIGKIGDVMNYVDKGINEVADTRVVRTARQNPLAIALIGLGTGILLIKGYQKKRPNYRYNDDYERDNRNYRRGFSSRAVYDERDEGRGFSSRDNKSTLAAAQDKVSGAAGAVSDSVSGAVSAVSDTVSDAASKTYNKVSSQAADLAETAQDQYDYYMQENPLAVGAVAMALGAAVGLAIPSTQVENRWMGETRENLVQKAEETARDAVGKVQQVAGQVKETVKEEAKNQGLT